MIDKAKYLDHAKFLQNILIENNYNCYLIGGALISSVRDNGILSENDDIDFAILSETTGSNNFLTKILEIFQKYAGFFSWTLHESCLTLYINNDNNMRIDFFLFVRKYLNFYSKDDAWIHEKIFSFQTFIDQTVTLENKSFKTVYRPDLFLKTVYGNYNQKKLGYNVDTGGDTTHMKNCFFYTSEENYDKIDFQVENLKNFFSKVNVFRSTKCMVDTNINIFDDLFTDVKYDNVLLYSNFINFLIKYNINYLKI